MTYKLYLGDCAEVLKSFDPDCIDLTVTSPPYDNLRTYNGFTFDFETIAKELFRVTKPGGVVVWVVGDATIDGSETGTSFTQALYFKNECGFNLHDTMIWHKATAPQTGNRFEQKFEYMFVFSKGPPKNFNPIYIKKDYVDNRKTKSMHRNKDGKFERGFVGMRKDKRAGNVWSIPTAAAMAERFEHPAIFPRMLAKLHIHSWSNGNETILDPFLGSGTTGEMAVNLGRNFIGIEISSEYLAIAEKRIKQAAEQDPLFLS